MPRNFEVPEEYQSYGQSKADLIRYALKEGYSTKTEVESFYNNDFTFAASQIAQVRAKLTEGGEDQEQSKKRRRRRQEQQNGASDMEMQNAKLRWLNLGLLKGWLAELNGQVVLTDK